MDSRIPEKLRHLMWSKSDGEFPELTIGVDMEEMAGRYGISSV
jgi:hypothetical protein